MLRLMLEGEGDNALSRVEGRKQERTNRGLSSSKN